MSLKIDGDVNRFKAIIRGKVKSNLKKFVSSQDLLSQKGAKTIRIPIKSIDLPTFVFGKPGGTGSGPGNPGDPMGGEEKPGDGKAGNEPCDEHSYAAEFSPEDLARMLGEELQLPDISEKAKGKIGSADPKYNTIRSVGPEGLRNFRRTYKQALKRSISSGEYNPSDPKVVPISVDKRYKAPSITPDPVVNAVIFYLIDCSGSMDQNAREIAQSEAFWIDAWLGLQYKGIETRWLIHDTKAKEVSREMFFTIISGGGTNISSGYKLISHLIDTEYPFADWNSYVCSYTDGDNWGSDNEECIKLLQEKILPNCNLFCYEQISTDYGSGDFIDVLNNAPINKDNLITNKISTKDEIINSIKTFLGTGK